MKQLLCAVKPLTSSLGRGANNLNVMSASGKPEIGN
jgi:hypothetical protein